MPPLGQLFTKALKSTIVWCSEPFRSLCKEDGTRTMTTAVIYAICSAYVLALIFLGRRGMQILIAERKENERPQ